jgi:hypothetical protein
VKSDAAWRRQLGRGCQLLVLLSLVWIPANRVVADNPPPPLPNVQSHRPVLAPAAPAAGLAGLYNQFDSPSSYWVSSQDSTDDLYDTRAADDFFVAIGSNSWEITGIEVAGFYSAGSGPKTVNSVGVTFYTDTAGKPGVELFTRSSVPSGGTDATGNFNLPLSPAVNLASNANYWVSVRAVQSTSWFWYWSQRTPQSQSLAVWQNPSNVFVTGCTGWTAIISCFPDTGNDLLFALSGNTSANHVTPILISLSPSQAAYRSFTLDADGAGFANGAILNWTLGTTQQFTTIVNNAARLSALIPAAAVSNYGATITVSVTNPGPCAQSCTSNELTFVVRNPLFLPLITR